MPVESVALPDVTQRKTTQFAMRMDPEVKLASEEAATQDRRSLASLIEILLIKYCQERGLLTQEGRLPPKPPAARKGRKP